MKYHEPVLLKESVDGLNIQPDGIYVDVTFGGGGHSHEILRRLKNGQLIAFDQDSDVLPNLIDDDRFTFVQGNFRYIKNHLRFLNIEKVDGILADLGVSSHHFDDEGRGFSFRFDSPLDMRMNRRSKTTAKEVVNQYSEKQLADIFYQYGELHNGRKIAFLILKAREKKEIDTIKELVTAIESCIPADQQSKYLAKVFQAIRIEVNKEMSGLKSLLKQAGEVIRKNGRLSVISYHSNEDRLVKNYIKCGNFEGNLEKDIYGNADTPFRPLSNKVIVPDEKENEKNSRARSAKLRIAEKN